MLYDTIVIGSGPAGMTSALYSLRANLKVGIIESGIPGGQMNNTEEIENYPGYKTIKGSELSDNMYESLEEYDNFTYIYGNVVDIENKTSNIKSIILEDGEIIQTKTIVIATGTYHKKLNVPGEDKFSGKGVSYCAICDGGFFKNKDVIVIGGGDSALEESLYLSNICKSVTIVHRRNEFRGQKIYQDKVFNTPNINIIFDSNVVEIRGENSVNEVVIENKYNKEHNIYKADGVFIYIGLLPNSSFLNQDMLTNDKWIYTNENMETIYPGIYAIGDVRDKKLRQVATAVGDGAISGQEVYNYITKNS